MPDNKTQDVAQQGSDSPSQPDGDGRWWWPWRSSSQHARDVATAAIPPRETPETGTPEPSRATIRIVPVVIYK
jgi:hypothetical protein